MADRLRGRLGDPSVVVLGSAAGGRVALLKERADVPAFTAADLDGRQVSTAALRGKVVIVNFWATWCPPCREEIPDLIALQNKYKDNLVIIGVSEDDPPPRPAGGSGGVGRRRGDRPVPGPPRCPARVACAPRLRRGGNPAAPARLG